MKRTVLIFILLVFCLCGAKAQEASRRTQLRPGKKNAIYTGFSYGSGSHNMMFYQGTVTYSRLIGERVSWGMGFTYGDSHTSARYEQAEGGGDPYRNTVCPEIAMLTGMFYYELPVDRRGILNLRLGGGIDLAYHRMHRDEETGATKYRDKLIPFLRAEIKWVLHVGSRLDIALAPLVLGSSYFSFSPMRYSAPSDLKTIWQAELMQFTIGYRFN